MKFLLPLLLVLLSIGCSDTGEQAQKHKAQAPQVRTIEIASVQELNRLFNDLNYTAASWRAGHREVPRIYFTKVGQNWKTTSATLPVKEKKNIFFRLLGPLVLISNEAITKERTRLLKEPIDNKWLKALAIKYKVLKKDEAILSQAQLEELKKRVDTVPVSLALTQGAQESGWGTSRFAAQGNALFGQWDFSGKGMKPAQQRKELGNYGLARFETPLDSVKGYMLNLNTGAAYEKFRTRRLELRKSGSKVSGLELAKTLDKYSERGQDYIKELQDMITYNKLQVTDDAYLSAGDEIHLVQAGQ